MKVNFSLPILDLNGAPIKEGGSDANADMTLASISCNALLAPYQDENNLDGAEKTKRFKLALKVNDGGIIDLAVEDVSLLKRLIAKGYAPLVVGRAYELLDPEA